MSLLLTADASELLALIDRIHQFGQRPLGLVDLPEELVSLNLDHSAASTGELIVRLDPSDALRSFEAAVCALDGESLVVEDSFHDATR